MQFFLLLWLAAINLAAAFEPKVAKSTLKSPTRGTLFFDDSSNLVAATKNGLWGSFDDGVTWKQIEITKDVDIKALQFDPYVKDRAFAFTESTKQYFTTDKGKTWKLFEIEDKKLPIKLHQRPQILHNTDDKDLLLFEVYDCSKSPFHCKKRTFFTKDGLKLVNPLPIEAELCLFAKHNKDFAFKGDLKTIICAKNEYNSFGHVMKSSILKSKDFFKSSEEIMNDNGFQRGRILDVRIESSFLMVTVLQDIYKPTAQVHLYVSKDAETFDKTNFNFETNHGALKYLPSSKLALFVAVTLMNDIPIPHTTLFRSDSLGINFVQIADRIAEPVKVENFDGVWFTSQFRQVEPPKKGFSVGPPGSPEIALTSKITFNDGKDWELLRLLDDDNCKLENGCSLTLLDIATLDGAGKMSTGPTANILLGVGGVDIFSTKFDELKTYISRDGGLSWKEAFDKASIFSFGDQGNVIIAASMDTGKDGSISFSKEYYYSIDQGLSWLKGSFEIGIWPIEVTTTIDGTSRKFVVVGSTENDGEVFYLLDFSNAYGGKKCKDKELEKVYARVVDDVPLCVYGHKESIMRRKPEAMCYVSKLFEDIKVKEEPCECTEADFECTKYFELSPKGACVPKGEKIKEACAAQKSKKIKLADKQLMAGNLCKQSGKQNFIVEQEFKCEDYADVDKPLEKKLKSIPNDFEGRLQQYAYIKTANDMRENLLVRTSDDVMYASNNGGGTFNKIPVYEKIVSFTAGSTPGTAALITGNDIFYLSLDGANSFQKLEAPGRLVPTRGLRPTFHPEDQTKFIWYVTDGCDPTNPGCEVTAHYTENLGHTFNKLRSGVQFCDYISLNNATESNLIYCLTAEERPKLISTTNFFKESEPKILFDHVASYALKKNYVIVATILEDKEEMRAKVTVDGVTFADALFPKDFKVKAQTAYNILDSADESIFMHVTTNNEKDKEVGSILKSNSNGTSYVLSLRDVNRGKFGFVDYDRLQALDGIIIANTVANPGKDEKKKLKSNISFNDGSQWYYLAPPSVDSEGKKYKCSSLSLEKCSLHLQSFTERPDFTDTFGSSSAIGVLFGVGNVGEYLGETDLSTFMSYDAGLTWKEVVKGQHMWEFGDQGTVLLLVDQLEETNTLMYSTDSGVSWQDFKFTDKNLVVLDLATVQSDTSLKFVIFAADKRDFHTTYSYSIDFTQYFNRQCELNLDKPDKGDFEFWGPKRPSSKDNCFFGREVKYLRRKKSSSDCFIGAAPLKDGEKQEKLCQCTRSDYECDYNYYRDSDGTCKLVDGLSPADRMKEMCEAEGGFQYFEPTGYRKLPLSQCYGGKGFDSLDTRPCPGKEGEYNEFYGIGLGGGRIFGVIFAPVFIFLAAFLFASWFVYARGIRRNGGFGRLGQIRLDDDDSFQPIEDNAVDVVVNRIVKGGIVVVAGTVATLKTIRKVDKAMFERLSLALFGRRPGRRNYVRVPDDEDELFGNFEDNYEDELENAEDVNFDVETDPEEFNEYADEPPVEGEEETDERLFDIDDQSDEDNRSSRREED